MDFKDLAKARYSLGKFSDKPIEKEKPDFVLCRQKNPLKNPTIGGILNRLQETPIRRISEMWTRLQR